ncbi:MAG: glycoside hydrolase family 13 protein [Clostridia bacterium]|nr:glycoside hydrolase family 13 protein [Clostridia bacterium]
MYIPYNCSKEYHKYPFGAVCDGTEVTLRIVLPRNFCCTGARVVLNDDSKDVHKVEMQWDCMQGSDEEWWKAVINFEKTGLYFYHFEYDTSWGTSGIYSSGGNEGFLQGDGNDWQITVYDKNFTTPEWIKGGIFYQIFPDRFYCSQKTKKNVPSDRILRTDYDGEPFWKPDKNGKVLNNDYFGGDLEGIRQKLPYLSSLGITCIYLNPIFEANSNHRYDTADYDKIDSLLGDEKDFMRLCESAQEEYGIKIILDGVFSHTGADSRYFNKFGRYDTLGAYNSKSSPYYGWYNFTSWPDEYKCWWDFETLPEVTEDDPDYIDFISRIAEKWLKKGAGGWRLDVADELPDVFLDEFAKTVKTCKPDALIIGEVWEDASNKMSYSQRRRYLLGGQLDSVMNYPFANAIIDFVANNNAEGLNRTVMTVIQNYPKPVVDVLMNHIGTHDTVRAITALAGESCLYRGREWQSGRSLTPEQKKKGLVLLKEAAIIQFTLPGVPCIYYGDEAGAEGYKDPFNRKYYPWGKENGELVDFYKELGRVRRAEKSFISGEYRCVSAVLGCIAYTRGSDILVIANSNSHPINYYYPPEWKGCVKIFGQGSSENDYAAIDSHSAVILKRL